MAQKTFGGILADARERQGMDIAFAAQQLRIRADILHAIEHNDFARMPARGYTRNMVNAYARLLGLNPQAITRQYLEEANAYQMSLRDEDPFSSRSSRGSSRRGERSGGSRNGRDEGRTREYGRRNQDPPYARERSAGRSRDTYSDRDERVPRYSSATVGVQRHPRDMRSSRSGRGDYSNGRKLFSGVSLPVSLPVIIGGIIAIVLVIFIITQIVSCAAPKQSAANTSVPITGVSDTTGGEDTNTTNTNTNATSVVTETAPTSVEVAYSVKSGATTYMEVYENGSDAASTAEVVTGPAKANYSVTNELEIKVIDPSAITITADGAEVELTADDSGMYVYDVKYADVLSEWTKTHKTSNTSNTTKNTNTTNANTNSNSNTNANTNKNAATA